MSKVNLWYFVLCLLPGSMARSDSRLLNWPWLMVARWSYAADERLGQR